MKKCSSTHTTFIKALKPVVCSLDKMSSVRTYVLGVIEQKGRDKRVKITKHQGALHLMTSGNGAVQGMWVYPEKGFTIEDVEGELLREAKKWKDYEIRLGT